MTAFQSKLKQLRRSDSVCCDVRFEVIDSSTGILLKQESENGDAAMIGAHKFILALGSPVFKMQFYGHLREDVRRVIRIVDSSPEVFRVFIKCFYEDVDLTQLNINFLCDLFYLGDKYCVEELKDGIIMTLASEVPDPADDPFLAVEAAVLGSSQSMFPELSEALFKKCVKILQWKFNSFIDDIEWLFNQMRNTYGDDLMDELLEDVKERLELAAVCPNCHKLPSECLNTEGLTADNWVSGARVRMSHVRFSLGGSRETVTLGNPAVHRLGSLNPDMTFTSSSSSGLPLSVATLHPCMYLYNC